MDDRIGEGDGLAVFSIHVAEIGRVGIEVGHAQMSVASHALCKGSHQGDKGQHEAQHSQWQTEGEAAALSHLAVGTDAAHAEDGTCLAVAFDDALAVHQSKSVAVAHLMGEYGGQLFFRYSLAGVFHIDFHGIT